MLSEPGSAWQLGRQSTRVAHGVTVDTQVSLSLGLLLDHTRIKESTAYMSTVPSIQLHSHASP